MLLALGVLDFTATDAAIPDPTDAAWPKWAAYGIADLIAVGYISYWGATTDSFAHTPKKQSSGKSGGDRHDKAYTHGGKNRPTNPNQKAGAEERKNKGNRGTR